MMRPTAKVAIGSLQEVVYEKSISTKMNDFKPLFRGRLRSCQPLRLFAIEYLGKPLRIEA